MSTPEMMQTRIPLPVGHGARHTTRCVRNADEDDGHESHANTCKEQLRISGGMDEVAHDCAFDQGNTDRKRKGNRQADHLNGSDKQHVGNVENETAERCIQQCAACGLMQVADEAERPMIRRAERKRIDQRRGKDTEAVVPVIELKAVTFRELKRICETIPSSRYRGPSAAMRERNVAGRYIAVPPLVKSVCKSTLAIPQLTISGLASRCPD